MFGEVKAYENVPLLGQLVGKIETNETTSVK